MVLDDQSKIKMSFKEPVSPVYYAHLLDRLSAFMLDLLVLTPLVGFIFAPFYRRGSEAYLAQLSEESFAVVGFGVGLSLLTVFSYFVLCTSVLGRTFGQKLFGHSVEHHDGSRLSFGQSIRREALWLAQLILLGWPMLLMLKDPRRRAPHDLVSESHVVSKKMITVHPAMDNKLFWFIQVGYALTAVTFIVPLAALVSQKAFSGFFHYSTEGGGCETVRETIASSQTELSRMDLGLSLYAAGEIDEKCLGKEASYNLWRSHDIEVAYLSKAFSESEQSETSDKYLKKVCESAPSSIACRLSQLVENWGELPRSELNSQLVELSRENEGYAKVWAARHFLSEGNYKEVLRLSTLFETEAGFKSFAGRLKMKSLLATHQTDRGADYFKSAAGVIGESQKSSWTVTYCAQQLENKCQFDWQNHCDEYVNSLALNEDWMEDRDDLLTWSRQMRCSDQESLTLLERSNWSDDMRDYSSALSYYLSRQFPSALEKWENIFAHGLDEKNVLALEAFRFWVWIADDRALNGENALRLVQSKKKGPRWQVAVRSLVSELYLRGFTTQAYEISESVSHQFPFLGWPHLVIALKLSGEGKAAEATRLVKQYGEDSSALLPVEGLLKRPSLQMAVGRSLASLGHRVENRQSRSLIDDIQDLKRKNQ